MTAAFWTPPRLAWFTLRWPRDVDADDLAAALLRLNGLSTPRRREPVVLRAVGRAGEVRHQVAVAAERVHVLEEQLRTAIPGLGLERDEAAPLRVARAWQAWMSSRTRPLNVSAAQASGAALLDALATAGPKETLVVEVLLGPVRRPVMVGSKHPGEFRGVVAVKAPLVAPAAVDPVDRRALATKQGLPGWRACVRLGVQASGRRRQRQLLGRLAAPVRMMQGPGVQVGFHGIARGVLEQTKRPVRWPLVLNVGELLGLTAWPVSRTEHLPVASVRSRQLPPSKSVSSSGRIIGTATFPGKERPLALPIEQARMHCWLVGATGTGKSTVALNLLVHDMAAGRGVVVVEPRGDLVEQVLERVPDDRLNDVVIIDPADEAPVGINPLADRRVRPELVVDSFVTLFKALAGDNLGPRSEDILTNGLLTLARQPEPFSLAHLPLLLTDAAFRRRLVANSHDPLGTDSFWQWFESLGSAERATVLAPILNKLRRLVVREPVRRVLGQTAPRFDISEVFTRHRIVVLNLNEAIIGTESAALLGAVFLSQLWLAIQRRAAIAPERRHVVHVVIDEWQRVLRLPGDLADVLTQARGLGVALTLANQHAAQLPSDIRSAVLANARSRIVFATGYDDAQALVRQDDRLAPADVVGLGRYEAFMSLMTADGPSPYMSARTLPPGPALRAADVVRRRSREQFGVPGAQVDAELKHAVDTRTDPVEDFGRRRRPTREDQ